MPTPNKKNTYLPSLATPVIASGAVRHIRAAIHKPVRSILLLLLVIVPLVFSLFSSPPKRYAIFAGYNPNGTIAPYVLTYLKALNEITDGVVYIADSELNPEEEQKIKDITIYTQHIRHNEYDWGSYKQGYNWLRRNGYLNKADELIFANDSTYAPLGGSFKPMFEVMDKHKDIDFWGDSQNKAFQPHLQSYFMVFRHPVFLAPEFRNFLNSVQPQKHSSQYILLYETTLTQHLANLGYKWDSYINYAHFPLNPEIDSTDINSYPLTAIRDFNHLFLKRRTFTTNLLIAESIPELLRHIAKHYPESYNDITRDIAPHFIPTDLSPLPFRTSLRGSAPLFRTSLRGSALPFRTSLQGDAPLFRESLRGSALPFRTSLQGDAPLFRESLRGGAPLFRTSLRGSAPLFRESLRGGASRRGNLNQQTQNATI